MQRNKENDKTSTDDNISPYYSKTNISFTILSSIFEISTDITAKVFFF